MATNLLPFLTLSQGLVKTRDPGRLDQLVLKADLGPYENLGEKFTAS